MRHEEGKKWAPQKADGGKSIKIQICMSERDGPSSAALSPFEFDKANCAIEYGVNCGRDFMRDTSGDDYAKHMSRKWTRERPREPRSTEVPRKTWID